MFLTNLPRTNLKAKTNLCPCFCVASSPFWLSCRGIFSAIVCRRSAIEGRSSYFLPRWLRTGWQSVINQGKLPWNTLPWPGIEPGPSREKTVKYINSPTELSWPRPRRGRTVRYIHYSTELSWPRAWRGQTVRYMHSPTELSWPRPRRGRTVRYIHSPTELWPGVWRGQEVRFTRDCWGINLFFDQ